MSFNMPNAQQMVPAGTDLFGGWYATLPADRRFSFSTVPAERQAEYQAWRHRHGFGETADYDLAGAFLSGQEPVDGHLGSMGAGGKVLKAPTHETFWKTALAEIVRSVGGEGAETAIPWDRLANRDQGQRWLIEYMGGAR